MLHLLGGDDLSTFEDRLKSLRSERNVFQRDIADYCDVNVRTIKFYESGKVNPTSAVIIKLCLYFNVSANYLLGLTDEPEPLYPDNVDNRKASG